MRRDAKTDANKPEIVDALHKLGCGVINLDPLGRGIPDILIWTGQLYVLAEIKSEDGKFTEAQKKFYTRWPGPVHVLRSVDDAVALRHA